MRKEAGGKLLEKLYSEIKVQVMYIEFLALLFWPLKPVDHPTFHGHFLVRQRMRKKWFHEQSVGCR